MSWPLGEQKDYGERGLRAMCDYGAAAVERGEYDALRLNIMWGERQFVKAYMEKRHPNVRYFMTLAGVPLNARDVAA